jgi:serine/threonine protein kinase
MPAWFPKPGDLFASRYRIESIIGTGGFARVYLATQEDLGREVAIKVLSRGVFEELDSTRDRRKAESASRRFQREARLVSQLKDPNTVTIFDFGETEDGLLFIVFEHVDGTNLKELSWREGPLDPARVVRILERVLSSLQEAHAMGVLHRDIKPSNVMVFDYMGNEEVKLLDFGVAKVRGSRVVTAHSSELTTEGALVGTPRYMAPEQIREREVSPASDIFSLGLVAFEMLTRERANDNKTPVKIISRQLDEEPFMLPDELDIPRGLRSCVHRMLEKDPERRFQNAQMVLDALEQWDRESLKPVDRSAEESVDQAGRPSEGGRFPVGVFVAIAVLAVAAAGVFLYLVPESPSRPVSSEPAVPEPKTRVSESRKSVEEVDIDSSGKGAAEPATSRPKTEVSAGASGQEKPPPEPKTSRREPKVQKEDRKEEQKKVPPPATESMSSDEERFAPRPVDETAGPVEEPTRAEPEESDVDAPKFFSLDEAM